MSEAPKDGLHVEHYENGQKMSEGHWKNGKEDGLATHWYENGQKRSERQMQAGKLVSTSVWQPNGEPCPITKVVDGSGICVAWHENGQKAAEGHFKNGEQDGLATSWYDNGQKAVESHFKDDKKDGLYTLWHENGQKKAEGHFKNGEQDGLTTHWYENGQKEEESNWKNGKQDGLTTHWYENGQKEEESNWKDGELDGLTTHWYENGQKEEESNWKDGELDGLTTIWNENGQKLLEDHYKDGKPGYFKDGKIVVRPLESPIAKIPLDAMWYLWVPGFWILFFFTDENIWKVMLGNGKGNALIFLSSLSSYTCMVIYSITVVRDKLQSGLTFFSWYQSQSNPIFLSQWFTPATLFVPIMFFIGGNTFATSVGASCLLGLLIMLYFIPTNIAIGNGHPQMVPLAIVNFFLGASVIGWAACLAWSLWRFDKPSDIRQAQELISKMAKSQ